MPSSRLTSLGFTRVRHFLLEYHTPAFYHVARRSEREAVRLVLRLLQ